MKQLEKIDLTQGFLSVPDTAAFLGISEGTLRKYVFNKSIPYYKVNKRILFSRDDLDKWLATKRVMPLREISRL